MTRALFAVAALLLISAFAVDHWPREKPTFMPVGLCSDVSNHKPWRPTTPCPNCDVRFMR